MNLSSVENDGFAVCPPILTASQCDDIGAAIAQLSGHSVGLRTLLELSWCKDLARVIRQHPAIAPSLPQDAVAVQCTYFEKSQEQNWLVPIHQDLSIPVKEKVVHSELAGWSSKDGATFVQPPEGVLRALVAVRLHIDECGVEDGPLRIVPGSHQQGRLDNEAALTLRDQAGEVVCPVAKGGVLLLKPLVLHASSKATGLSRRRVLHFVFGPRTLPCGLQWRHAVG